MTTDEAFIKLLAIGVAPEDAKELLDAVTRKPLPIRPREVLPAPEAHQPVWALMDRPFGIATGFKQMTASERCEDFDMNAWVGGMQ
jgi:hypothetical protein